jgi:flagellar basal-body rod protein FlgB
MQLQPFAQHEMALKLRAQRNEVLSSNIANADTPNYKARDVDFRSALQTARGNPMSLTRTSDLHRTGSQASRLGADVKYRVPVQPTLDGNTVETDVEQAAFAENAVQYRASLAFLNGTIRTLKFAIRGSD